MKKKIILICSLILLFACQNNQNITSSFEASETANTSEEHVVTSEDVQSETLSYSSSSDEDNKDSQNESISSDSSEKENLSKIMHDYYLENSKVDKYTLIPIQGQFIGYEKYEKNPNCNAWFQDGKYGYHVINVPFESIELGKSYMILGMSLERDYYGINAKCDEYTLIEVENIPMEIIDLNQETPINDDYIGARVKIQGEIFTLEDNMMTMIVNGETYKISYNKEVISASEILKKWQEYQVGDSIELSGILHATNREIRLIDAKDIM